MLIKHEYNNISEPLSIIIIATTKIIYANYHSSYETIIDY